MRPAARAADDTRLPLFVRGEIEDLISPDEADARGLMVLELGNDWVPDILAAGLGGPNGRTRRPNHYQATYRALANEVWPDDHHGRRAQRDNYLELYGIVPTLTVLARRFEEVREATCHDPARLEVIRAWDGLDLDEDDELDPEGGDAIEREAIRAIQERLACDGHYRRPPTGVLDARTRAALAEFERRHRIYARGSLSGPTLAALATEPLELERRAVVRALTERAILDLGVIEDGSGVDDDGDPVTYRDRNGQRQPVRNLEAELTAHIERAFGLASVTGARRFLAQVGDPGASCAVTLAGVTLPDYQQASELGISVEIDRGDIWYDFPYEADGTPREQPVERRPTLTVFAELNGRRVPMARYGTTIGGWRILRQNGRDVWRYKESPVGRRAWAQIVSAPVWLPPEDVPPAALVMQTRRTLEGELIREINQDLVGPGYASAYGLVAAYHRLFTRRGDGTLELGSDEGIRTHGSGDYTSIWRRASLGCHRLHNHRALRLFSFILKHRRHRRIGHRPTSIRIPVSVEDFTGEVRIDRTGHVFELETPIVVEVLRGRVRGRQRRPSTRSIPVNETIVAH